ncbi:hypothetical protein [Sediminivirga luteola]|uniref:hypothetical protein n=1 Tax=Sediminivirga luteola TaxID=1774748 RepID=UPI001F59555A|nr:hypothetical protein [Sediminivirga luteola]MCI2265702.1 hypothetical protein [Sediminivirga luteola]
MTGAADRGQGRSLTAAAPLRPVETLLRRPVWQQALLVYALTGLVTLGFFSVALRTQGRNPWTGDERPTLIEFLNFWDAGWYERIATDGYPAVLPTGADGQVLQNAWAFYPLYPLAAGDLSALTGMGFGAAAIVVSVLAAAAASIVVLVLFRGCLPPASALTGLALVLLYPASAVLMTGYAESLGLLCLAFALYLVRERLYMWAIPVVGLMCLSRPIGVAFSFFMLAHLIRRFRLRDEEPYPAREVVSSWALGVLSCAFALLHPFLAYVETGSPTAYTDTEAAWHSGQTLIVTQWFAQAENLMGPAGWVVLVALLAGLGWVLAVPGRRLGADLQYWCGAYALYLLLFFTPQTSTFRLLIPLFPLLALLALPRGALARAGLLTGFAALQLLWILAYWVLGGVSVAGPP